MHDLRGNEMIKRQVSSFVRFGFVALTISLLLGVFSATARAQQTYGSINGIVTDPNGAVVPNAMIIATNEGTSTAVSATADSAGTYIITNMQAGNL